MNLSNFNPPFFVPYYCVFPADAMMRHLLACLLLIFVSFFSKTLLSSRCTVTPKGGEPGIWLPLALNKQLFSDSHGCAMVLREEHPLGNQPGDRKWGERMKRRKMGKLKEEEIEKGLQYRDGM